ncbi:hypothetical protein TSUD_210060 [Trifolium subterraneum]|uniref:Uncharacterized protein n=1 Tax=Trifolium subterraneum TaxID=3900 RepID=A0A2Z6NEA2_TRISU|nr:hypothetical protein TSUD_210060 [Trifolium subterraneum]
MSSKTSFNKFSLLPDDDYVENSEADDVYEKLNRNITIVVLQIFGFSDDQITRHIRSALGVRHPVVEDFFLLPDYLENSEVADIYEQLNRNITAHVLKTLGFSKDMRSRLTYDEISRHMEYGFFAITNSGLCWMS